MVRTCPSCGAKNRIPAARLMDRAKCGRCKTALEPPREPIDVYDAAMFDEIVAGAPVPVLVDFWAEWCGPCRMVAPEVKKVAEDLAGRAVVLKVDTEALPQVAGRYGIQAITASTGLPFDRLVLESLRARRLVQ